MTKKKQQGHFCVICGERKANERFSAKGHAKHICLKCQSLPIEEQTDMRRCRDVERLFCKYSFSRNDWELLEKYAKKYGKKESGKLAQDVLDSRRYQTIEEVEPDEMIEIPFIYNELEDYDKDTVMEIIMELVEEYLFDKGVLLGELDFSMISIELLKTAKSDYGIYIKADESLEKVLSETVQEIIKRIESEEEPF